MPFDRDLFLPVSREDMARRGWDFYDFLLITGDAYVDHPSFGLEERGGIPVPGPAPAGGAHRGGEHRLHGGPLHRRQKAPP